MSGIQNVVYFAIFLGVLVTVHEAGHFLVAKWCGVKVEKFSIGFGPKLLSFRRGETEYQLAALPLGGFVAMAGERPGEVADGVDPSRTFSGAAWYRRFAIIAAGPVFNLIFPVFALFFVFVGSHSAFAPKVSWVEPDFPAARAGIQEGDVIVKIGNTDIRTFDEVRGAIEGIFDRAVPVTVRRGERQLELTVSPAKTYETTIVERTSRGLLGVSAIGRAALIGVPPDSAAAKAGLQTFDRIFDVNGKHVVGASDLRSALETTDARIVVKAVRSQRVIVGGATLVVPSIVTASVDRQAGSGLAALGAESAELYVWDVFAGSPAARAGLKVGDRLVSVDGAPLSSWTAFQVKLRQLNQKPFELRWRSVALESTARVAEAPEASLDDFKSRHDIPELGLRPRPAYIGGLDPLAPIAEPDKVTVKMGPLEALGAAMKAVPEAARQIARVIAKLVTRDLPLESVGGPILLFQVASKSAEAGIDDFLRSMALVSVNLALVNLLPIPVLDGFGLLAAAWEGIRRRPIPARAREVANIIGLAVLALLVVLVFKNDITKLMR